MTILLIALAAWIGATIGFVFASALCSGKAEDEYSQGYRNGRRDREGST